MMMNRPYLCRDAALPKAPDSDAICVLQVFPFMIATYISGDVAEQRRGRRRLWAAE